MQKFPQRLLIIDFWVNPMLGRRGAVELEPVGSRLLTNLGPGYSHEMGPQWQHWGMSAWDSDGVFSGQT